MKKLIFVFLLIVVSLTTLTACTDKRQRLLNIENGDIALLSIFSDDGKTENNFIFRNYGHAFLSITNISSNSFVVGDTEVAPDETITVGLWNIAEHFGVWYNVESNYIAEYNKYNNRYSLTIGINSEDIDKISKSINDNNNWDPIFNCSKFALITWNKVAQESEKIKEKFIVTPTYLVSEIKKFDEREINKEIITNKTVRYYKEG